MLKQIAWIASVFCIAGVALADDTKTSGFEAEVHRFFTSFADALRKGDAKAVGDHFTDNALHVGKDSGKRTEGKEALQQLYKNVFQSGRVKSVEFSTETIRQVTPDVIAVDVSATVTRNDGPAANTLLHALLTKHDGKWQLNSVQEEQEASAPKPFETLQSLSWMIGNWKDEEGKLQVRTKCEWTNDHSFITRTYTVSENGKTLHEGTQKIGYDAVDDIIRSWSFENDGSFGEGYWKFDGKQWTITLRGRTPAGLDVSSTQIITPTDKDSYTTQMVSRELGGKILPNGPVVKVVRAKKDK